MSLQKVFCLIVYCLMTGHAVADGFWLRADVNGYPMKLALHTTGSGILVFHESAVRAGLELQEGRNSPNNKSTHWSVEDCLVKIHWSAINKTTLKSRVDVLEFPADFPSGFRAGDGYIGWRVVRNNIIEIDAETSSFEFHKKVPTKTKNWLRASVQTNHPPGFEFLELELTSAEGKKIPIVIDTGLEAGVCLPPGLWLSWDKANANVPRTLTVNSSSQGKMVDIEQGWAARFNIGPLCLTEVIVQETSRGNRNKLRSTNGVILGRTALRRLDIIVDGAGRVAYLRPKESRARPVNHNRLGAVFLPSEENHQPVAHVAENSPAYEAGIRYGDVLVSLNGRRVEHLGWNELKRVHDWFAVANAGNKANMVLRRGLETIEVQAVLRSILPPEQ